MNDATKALVALANLIDRELAENDGERLGADVAMSVVGQLRALATSAPEQAVVWTTERTVKDPTFSGDFCRDQHGPFNIPLYAGLPQESLMHCERSSLQMIEEQEQTAQRRRVHRPADAADTQPAGEARVDGEQHCPKCKFTKSGRPYCVNCQEHLTQQHGGDAVEQAHAAYLMCLGGLVGFERAAELAQLVRDELAVLTALTADQEPK